MTTNAGTMNAYGYTFNYNATHALRNCGWCATANSKALATMRDDIDLKTVTSHRDEPFGARHTVVLTRQEKTPTYGYTWKLETPRETVNLSGHIPFGVSGAYRKEDPAHPVALDLSPAEAAMVLGLLDAEEERQSDEADSLYQNGDGYEAECVQARQLAKDAEMIADRLRKALAEHLDKAYAGELGS